MAAEWIDAGPLTDLQRAGSLLVDADNLTIRIVQVAGTLHAFEDRCTHDGEPLDGAEIDADDGRPAVICPRHGARFCLRDGAALTPPAYEPIRIFDVRQRGDRVEVRCA